MEKNGKRMFSLLNLQYSKRQSTCVNHTGAYHYVVQVLLNNFAFLQQNLYVVLENNSFRNDILVILSVSVNELAYLQFMNHETGKLQLINKEDLAKLHV